jgi:hypothetical protein
VSKIADAAFEWLTLHAPPSGVSTKTLWESMQEAYPELTSRTETRKTPRNTLIRDMRLDAWGRFEILNGHVRLIKPNWRPGDKSLKQLMRP